MDRNPGANLRLKWEESDKHGKEQRDYVGEITLDGNFLVLNGLKKGGSHWTVKIPYVRALQIEEPTPQRYETGALVLKFGGSSLPDERAYQRVGNFIYKTYLQAGEHTSVFVVLSAQKGTTDKLMKNREGFLNEQDFIRYLLMEGEIKSVHKLSKYLDGAGLDHLSHSQLNWDGTVNLDFPLLCSVSGSYQQATPLIEDSIQKLERHIGNSRLHIVSGYGAVTTDGNVGLYDRGGTDIVATQLACVSKSLFDEVELTFMKDKREMLTSDPENANAEPLDKISLPELRKLISGSKPLHHQVADLLEKELGGYMKVKFANIESYPKGEGTLIVGEL